jgi:hypothetical protein
MNKKNPLTAGLLNLLIPALGYFYVDGLLSFIPNFIGATLLLIILVYAAGWGGIAERLGIPQGTLITVVLLFYALIVFTMGIGRAQRHNKNLT